MNKETRRSWIEYGAEKWAGRVFWMVAESIEQTGESIPRVWFMIGSPAAAKKFIDEGNPRLDWFASDRKPRP